jgi:hypothetical protein
MTGKVRADPATAYGFRAQYEGLRSPDGVAAFEAVEGVVAHLCCEAVSFEWM